MALYPFIKQFIIFEPYQKKKKEESTQKCFIFRKL